MHFKLQQKMSSETLKPKLALPDQDTNPVVTESDIVLMPENSWLQVLEQEAPHLFVQLEAYVKILHSRLSNRIDDKERVDRGLDWAGKYIAWKFLTRLNRANDLSRQDERGKPIVGQAAEIVRRFLGANVHNFFVTCIDGRNIPTVMVSQVPHVGGVMRTQAGEILSAVESMNGEQVLWDTKSKIAKAIRELVENRPNASVMYGLDSHFGCAAREKVTLSGGGLDQDKGLCKDISRKLKIGQAIQEYVAQLRSEGKAVGSIIPEYFSYDPHDGTMCVGLEMHVMEAQKSGGFTAEVIDRLASEDKIVRSWDFLNDAEIVAAIEAAHSNPADFRNQFAETLLSNWQGIDALYDGGNGFVFKRIYDAVVSAYVTSGYEIGTIDNPREQKISQAALEHKAKFMLQNVVTRWSISGTKHDWPYAEHLEQGVVITEGGYGPFECKSGSNPPDVFAVFSKEDLPSLLEHVKLAVDNLVRTFRRTEKINDPIGVLSRQEFIEAPIIVMNHAVVRSVSESVWDALSSIDFTDAFAEINWDDASIATWDESSIRKLIQPKLNDLTLQYKDSEALNSAFFELFVRVRYFMSDPTFRLWIVHGNVLFVPKLVDEDRRPRVLVPMVF